MSRGWTALTLCVVLLAAPDVAPAADADSVIIAPPRRPRPVSTTPT